MPSSYEPHENNDTEIDIVGDFHSSVEYFSIMSSSYEHHEHDETEISISSVWLLYRHLRRWKLLMRQPLMNW